MCSVCVLYVVRVDITIWQSQGKRSGEEINKCLVGVANKKEIIIENIIEKEKQNN